MAAIAPSLVLSQVRNTAAWALDAPLEPAPLYGTTSWRDALQAAPTIDPHSDDPAMRRGYLKLLLAAHFTTVMTFVPTDVDSRIRYHAWQHIYRPEELTLSVELVDEVAAWDPRPVSARVVEVPDVGGVSGHDGEWLAVRAGALGRALALRNEAMVEHLSAAIEAELVREARALTVAMKMGDAVLALKVATVLAHNAGDLSRVVEEWPTKSPEAARWVQRFARLGHEDPARFDGAFVRAGTINKAVMALENHRFLPLRDPRALRRSRALLMPVSPFFDGWGELVGRHKSLTEDDRAEVLAALVQGHSIDASQQSYLRAIAGLHRSSPGGVDRLIGGVPARLRKLLAGGPIREALRIPEERFVARMANRYEASLRG